MRNCPQLWWITRGYVLHSQNKGVALPTHHGDAHRLGGNAGTTPNQANSGAETRSHGSVSSFRQSLSKIGEHERDIT